MNVTFSKNKKVFIPWILILLSLFILTFKFSNLTPKRIVISFFAPLQKGVTYGYHGLVNFGEKLFSGNEKDVLVTEINLLESRITELEEERLENIRLRQLLSFKERETFEELLEGSVGAEVIGRDPSNWYRMVTIDKGIKDNVEKGMAVITAEGVVGCISESSSKASQVRLILDGTASIGGLVQRSRESGVVRGNGTDLCEMVYLAPFADINKGDLIISSGLGGIYPPGLKIGEVASVKTSGYFRKAIVIPAVDFSRLEEVLVLRNKITNDQAPITR